MFVLHKFTTKYRPPNTPAGQRGRTHRLICLKCPEALAVQPLQLSHPLFWGKYVARAKGQGDLLLDTVHSEGHSAGRRGVRETAMRGWREEGLQGAAVAAAGSGR